MTLNEIANTLPKQFSRQQLLEALKKAYGEGLSDSIQTIDGAANALTDPKHSEIKSALKAVATGLSVGKDFLTEMA